MFTASVHRVRDIFEAADPFHAGWQTELPVQNVEGRDVIAVRVGGYGVDCSQHHCAHAEGDGVSSFFLSKPHLQLMSFAWCFRKFLVNWSDHVFLYKAVTTNISMYII